MGKQGVLSYVFLLLLGFYASGSRAQEHITLLYNDRPPYLISNADGSVSGLTGNPASNAFRAAGIAFVWEKIPTNRQLSMIKESAGLVCGVGWFKNPERLTFAKFTKAIYRDKPTIVIANLAFFAKDGMKLADILAMSQTHMLVKDKYSYGPYVDDLLLRLKPAVLSTTSENIAMIKMIKANRADFMLASEEEADYFVDQAGYKLIDFKLLKFQDMPVGEKRYVMCSKSVPDETIEKLNKAIHFE